MNALQLLVTVGLALAAGSTAPVGLARAADLVEVLAKAEPDECFDGIGEPTPPGPPCAAGVPKANEAYIWGLAKVGPVAWFGTIANTPCLARGLLVDFGGLSGFSEPGYVCELGESALSPPLPAAFGDHRPPNIYAYDTRTGELHRKSPLPDPAADLLLRLTTGIRSVGSADDVVLLAGPALVGGIHLFAFRAGDGGFVGAARFAEYTNIRSWLTLDGVLYTAVGDREGGRILRWVGNLSNPFEFHVVGDLDNFGAYLTAHEGRIFAATWPPGSPAAGGGLERPPPAGLFMSPIVPPAGLQPAHAERWRKVWDATQYEPDPLIALTYGGGALHSFGGYLYWGTMHTSGVASFFHDAIYGPPQDLAEQIEDRENSKRVTSIFRGRDLGLPSQRIELLYGEPSFPVFLPALGWIELPNRGFQIPRFGASGFGNPFNDHSWSMAVFGGQLYLGTFDSSIRFFPNFEPSSPYGGDLYRFPDADSPAAPITLDGFANPFNWGMRNMLADRDGLDGDDGVYVGTANPFNVFPEGGWELIRLSPQ